MKHIFALLLAFACLTPAFTHTCIHDELNIEQTPINSPDDETSNNNRILATYEKMRIVFDFSNLASVPTATRNYIKEVLIPPAKNYLEAALTVQPFTGTIKLSSGVCGKDVPIPSSLTNTGVTNADLVIIVTAKYESDQSYLAYASSCNYGFPTLRPVSGFINFNSYYTKPTTNPTDIESDIYTTIHEITHVLGFSSNLYKNYINPDNNVKLTGHHFTKTINGKETNILNVKALTDKIIAHFGCDSVEGAYLENQGDSGSAGSHFERRIFHNEFMTASEIKDQRITEFTLALLEGTGWYKPNYAMAEKFIWGKARGCDFFTKPCFNKDNPTATFGEFCTRVQATACTYTGRGFGYCGNTRINTDSSLASAFNYWGNNTVVTDSYADNCPYIQMFGNVDCEDSSNQGKSMLKQNEYYGRGSMCFEGNIYPDVNYAIGSYGFCFKSKCETTSGVLSVAVTVGSQTVKCTKAEEVSVTGYSGKLKCPDPATFCPKLSMKTTCQRGCTGKGTCVNDVCQCEVGWTGFDCATKTYANKCTRCASWSDPTKTFCYGDSCVCDPSDPTCEDNLDAPSNDGSAQNLTSVKEDDGGLSTGAIAGIASGGAAAILSILVGLFKYGSAFVAKLKGTAGAAGAANAGAPTTTTGNLATGPSGATIANRA